MIKDNKIYVYNDNFLSLLALIIKLAQKKIIPINIKATNYIGSLFDELCEMNLPETGSSITYIIKKIGYNNFSIIFKLYLSNEEDKERNIYYYFLYSLKYKERTIYMKNNKWILNAVKISSYVSRENHKFKGFTRFKKMENDIYYAEINPTNNILYLLSDHFKKRLSTEYWIIKDVNRKIYSIYDKKSFYIVDENEFKIKNLKEGVDEQGFVELWKEFYKTIGISSRKNDHCRMNFMPKKYWKYIVEVSDEL